jgi:simple sugar transport system substrate-binding protein
MAKDEQLEVDPKKYEVSRRRFLRMAGMTAAAVPFAGGLTDILTERGASAQTFHDEEHPLFASHPKYQFTFVNHVTTDSFFVACRYGIADACNILGIPQAQWVGSTDSVVSEMVSAFDVAIDARVKGIACALISPTAFNPLVDRALGLGIPVVSYNADEPSNDRMAYIGQSNTLAGAAAAERIVKVVPKGGLVGMVIATPGAGDLQPRINGALPVLKAAGLVTQEVAGSATGLLTEEIAKVEAWYIGHKDVKFLYGTGNVDGIGIATCISKYNLRGKVGGSAWDVSPTVLTAIKSGDLLFSIDQQSYMQGFIPTVQLFLYQISAGLMKPCDTDTGLGFITSSNVDPYTAHSTRWEGASSTESAYPPPSSIAV